MSVVAFIHAVEEVNQAVNSQPEPPQSKPIVRFCCHIKDDGIRCGTPAVKGRHFCYYHARAHHPGARPGTRRYRPPLPDSVTGLQIALAHTMQALASGDLTPKQANSMMYGVSLATNMLRHVKPLTDDEQQQIVTEIPPEMEEVLVGPQFNDDSPIESVYPAEPDTDSLSRHEQIRHYRRFIQPPDELQRYRNDERNFHGTSDPRYTTAWGLICRHEFAVKKLRELGETIENSA